MDLTQTDCKGDVSLVPALQAWLEDMSALKTASFQFLVSKHSLNDSGIL